MIYLRTEEPLQDSKRARRRVAALIESIRGFDGISDYLAAELGVDVSWYTSGVNWPKTLEHLELQDFLDLFTLAGRYLDHKEKTTRSPDRRIKEQFLKSAQRIFSEENLRYEIDSAGGVHPKVDAEFAASTNATIAALGLPRYGNARAEFDAAMGALSGADLDGKQAIRGVFNAVECVYKLMFTREPKLTAAGAVQSLQPTIRSEYSTNPTALRAALKMVNAFVDWVDACHNYRHEEGVEEPSQPPTELAIELVSAGAAFLRWLIWLDKKLVG